MTDRFVLVPASYVYLLRDGDRGTEVLLQLRSGTPRVVEAHKAAEVGWFPLSALPEPMVPHEAYALAQLSSGAVYLTFGFDA